MSRTAAVIVVLALAGSPDAAILCQFLCAPTADVTTACDHEGDSLAQIAAPGDCCDDMVAATASSQFQALRRNTSLPGGELAVPVLRNAIVLLPATDHLGHGPGCPRSSVHRPLTTILRI